jgi:diguanylate cyclase (GGDEF)-like protein
VTNVLTLAPDPAAAPEAPAPRTGVTDRGRLAAVARAELTGHLHDVHLDAVVETLAIACDVPMAIVNVVTPGLQTYPAEIGIGSARTTVTDELSFCAEVVETGEPLVVADATTHPVYAGSPMVLDGRIGAYAGVPLVHDGYVFGSVAVLAAAPRDFSDAELAVLHHQARLAGAVLSLRRSATTDPLTGLPNRTAVMGALDVAVARRSRQGGGIAVLFVDVDHFKTVNDDLGHDAGDRLLADLARRMLGVVRRTDVLGRFGGDEFVAVCSDVANEQTAAAIVSRLLAAAGDVPVSVGVAWCAPDDGDADAAYLLRTADAAMYRAKQRTGSRWELARRS